MSIAPIYSTADAGPISGLANSAVKRDCFEDSRDSSIAQLFREELYPLPPPNNLPPRPLNPTETARVDNLSRLQFFLATAPTQWSDPQPDLSPSLNKFSLPNGECVACVLWRGLFHITGTDIVRALAFRFEAFGRPVRATKKWEEGVFSDLRNLKPGTDAALEEPKSPLLEFLFRHGCIRTQKKQKVFYWFSVPHDRLFLDALERDLKREKAGQEPTSVVNGEPAMSFRYDPRISLYEQFAGKNPGLISSALPSLPSALRSTSAEQGLLGLGMDVQGIAASSLNIFETYTEPPVLSQQINEIVVPPALTPANDLRIFKTSILPGSSDYKQRRRSSRRPFSSTPQLSQQMDPAIAASVINSNDMVSLPRAWTSSPRITSTVGDLNGESFHSHIDIIVPVIECGSESYLP
ncbi:uncharacterized protein IL334_002004 [Kwoniella shivajii]|uniref:STE12 n=1 Tax=Kwoniella shivajii TaxID=564305 RepID=A0ABZ1CTG4_9TREE|nr:hypothetical protein IL334_002004 [Kwoniella shivajii]